MNFVLICNWEKMYDFLISFKVRKSVVAIGLYQHSAS